MLTTKNFRRSKMKKYFLLIVLSLFFFIDNSYSNNIQVSTVTLTGQNKTSHYTAVQFNLSWENSWRDALNFDAAWVFVKYKTSYDTVWKHATLSTTNTTHIVPAGFTRSVSSDGKGIFVYRSAEGSGSNSITGAQLRWMYGTDGVGDYDLVTIKVFAIEMVYVPEGSFYAGDGYTTTESGQFSQGNTTSPYLITSEASITLGGTATTNLGNRNNNGMPFSDDFNNSVTQTLPAAFPKGYNDFFCMKYEISQGQYRDFLNTLSRWQQNSRVASDITGDAVTNYYVMSNTASYSLRNVIYCSPSGNGTTQPINFFAPIENRACNFLSWMDGCAYMDWTGLRPLTDLELEKVCRGPLTPVPGECAWGNTTIVYASALSSTSENGTEYVTTANANCCGNNQSFIGGEGGNIGPVRCGIFARTTTTRVQSGATYWGIMEMSGNVFERIVTLGNSTGRLFDGLHGDGNLSVNGNGNVTNWPGLTGGEITGATGCGNKMGCFTSSANLLIVSSRTNVNSSNSGRGNSLGFRGGHSAPTGIVLNKIKPEENKNKNNE
jgi:formylglycine-generating enzyme required for sulfatase activity